VNRLRLFSLLAAVALIASACGGDGEEAEPTEEGGAAVVRHAASSTADAYIPQYRAPEVFGDLFGISTEEHLNQFESHATAAQVVVSGRADVGSGALINKVQLVQQGQDFKMFCPIQKDSTEHLVGLTDRITSLDKITDPDIRVAIDSPGGLINFIMNFVFSERGLNITTDDLENVVVLEDGSLRLAALAAGDVDVGSVDLFEVADLRGEVGDDAVTVLSVVAEDVEFLANTFWAPTEWLEQNAETAGRYCANVLYANRVFASDFDQYQQLLNEYIEGGVDEDTARTNWDFAREHQIWPYNTDVLNEESVQATIEVGIASGLLEESAREFSFEELVDTRPMEIAMDILGGPIDAEDVEAGNIPEPSV
jgi:ABC-type nitrate/sulfonate/bicarbonate transport system substrate-binding protein